MDETWQEPLLLAIRGQLAKTPWSGNLESGRCHLAVLIEPYLSRVLASTKTVESRFCRRKWAPYGMVHRGDTLILKRSSGPVAGICKVAETHYFDLTKIGLDAVRKQFGAAIGVSDETFWKTQRQARFVSLFRLQQLMQLKPIACQKHDRRAWVVMDSDHCESIAHRARELIRHQFAISLNPASRRA